MSNTYFDNYLDLFQHPGWKQFVAESKEVHDALSYDGCRELHEFITVREGRNSLNKIINFENFIRLSLEQIEESTNDSV